MCAMYILYIEKQLLSCWKGERKERLKTTFVVEHKVMSILSKNSFLQKNMDILRIIILILIISNIVWFFNTYNMLVRKRNLALNAKSGIDAFLQERLDSISAQLSELERLFCHEKEVLENVTALRSGIERVKVSGNENERYQMLRDAEDMGFFLKEAYPTIMAGKQSSELAQNVSQIEMRLNASRRNYNASATLYNNAIAMVPVNLVAKLFRFSPMDLYASDAEAKTRPIAPYEEKIWKKWKA